MNPEPATTMPLTPPLAARHPHPMTLHGDTREDDWFWLREKESPEVIAHLDAENAYTEAMTRDSLPLQEALYAEMLARLKQTDLSVPYRRGGFLYYSRTEEGRQYPIRCRRERDMAHPEQVLLDLNALAAGHAYLAIDAWEVSPDGTKLAYTIDTTGYRQYVLQVKDLSSGETLADRAERVTSLAWTADSRALWYTQEHEVSKRSFQLRFHALGAGGEDAVAHEEPDERFNVGVSLTRSGEWLVYSISSHTTSEARVRRADAHASAPWTLLAPRVQDRECWLDHRGEEFWIRVNDTGRCFRVVTAPVGSPGPEHWTEVLPHRPEVMIEGLECFRDHVVLSTREHALPQIDVLDPARGRVRRVAFPEPAYTVSAGANEEYAASTWRYRYESFVTPASVFDLDVATLDSTLLKRTEVLGGWDAARYVCERISAPAADGVAIPVTLLRRRDLAYDGTAPCLLYGYGSYGISSNVLFNSNRFSLIDRGLVYALAHVRGGGDGGKPWHDAARMEKKPVTFTDFIACAQALLERRIAAPGRIVIHGGSAGGLLVGAVANLDPGRFRGVLAQVPFFDVLTTMLDESLPLTVGEFEEWGNPKLAEQYAWMRAYSPYDNLTRRDYPAMLVKTSLNDSQVGYWEPAKYVARLRTLKTDANPLLFRCNMGAGHGGASGRYDALREIAFDYAWVLRTLGAG
jgi:oligopeptidase B